MSKKLLVAVFLALFTPLPLVTFAQTAFPLSESFEDGSIPDTWTIEYLNADPDAPRIPWLAEKADAYAYPAGTTHGDWRVAFRNTTGIETKARTRLVSPVFDPTELANPVLCFSYATPRWNGAFDTLYVKYRNVEKGDEQWINLHRITSHANTWQSDTVALIAWTEKYQIAFEAVDHLGRGVVLDDIVVRPLPQCIAPYSLMVDDITASSAHLAWGAGFSQDGFHLKVSTHELKDFALDDPESKADVVDEVLDGSVTEYTLGGLKPGSHCYWYVRTVCGDDYTDWVKGMDVVVPNQIKVPFTEDFNVEGINVRTHPENWTWANSFGGDAPFINANTTDWFEDASYDETTALIFGVDEGSGNQCTFGSIEAGEWAYVATPELLVDNIALVQAKFSAASCGTVWNRVSKIIVGVMTDPKDISTFVMVDMVEAPQNNPEFAVSFASYEGTGKHIALLSRFDEKNLIAIDNFTVEMAPTCPKVRTMSAIFPSAESMVLDWDNYSATSGQILISKSFLSGDNLDNATEGVRRIDAPTVPYTVTNAESDALKLEPDSRYYIYIRNKCGEDYSAWSGSFDVTMPDTITSVPKQGINTFKVGQFAVLPEVVGLDLKTLEVKFTASGNVMVGVLDTLGSETSFTMVEQTTGTNSIRKVNFADYTGKGRFIALFGGDFVSDVKLGYISTCDEVTDLLSTPSDITAELSWKGTGAKYEVRVATSDVSSKLDDASFTGYHFVDTIETTTVTVDKLQPSNTKYYWWVRTVCPDADEPTKIAYSDWSLTQSFATLCPAENELPYIVDLENMSGALTDHCINVREYQMYPQLKSVYTIPGYSRAIEFRTWNREETTDIYVVFNPVKIDDVKKLMLSFKMINLTSQFMVKDYPIENQHLEIGVMDDYNDYESFVKVASFASSEREVLEEQVVSFAEYTGTGKYIAIRALKSEVIQNLSIVDIRIEQNPGCVKVATPMASDITGSSAKLSWRKSSDSKWQMVVADGKLDADKLAEAIKLETVPAKVDVTYFVKQEYWPYTEVQVDTFVTVYVADDAVTANTNYDVQGLAASTKYYTYLRAVCGEGEFSSWSNPAIFSTPCAALTPEDMGVEDFEVAQYKQCETRPDCWTMHNTIDAKKWAPVITDEMAYSGKYSLKVASEVKATSEDMPASYAVMPALDVDAINNYRMTFYGSCGFLDYNVLLQWNKCQVPEMPRVGRIIVGVTSSTTDMSRIVAIDTIQGYEQWQRYTVSFAGYEADDYGVGTNVVFVSEFNQNNVFYIDDISFTRVEEGECAAPLAIGVDEDKTVAEGEVALRWQSGVAPYTVKVADRQLSAAELAAADLKGVVTAGDVTATNHTVSGISSASVYYVYVGSKCGEEMLWSEPFRLKADCPAKHALPYTENFNGYTAREGVMPDCWRGIYSRGNEQINRYPHVATTGMSGNGLYVYTLSNSSMSYAVLPQLDTEDISKCEISFDAVGDHTAQRSVVIGTVTDLATDVDIRSTFQPIDTVLLTGTEFKHFTVSLAKASPSAKAIVLTSAYDVNWHETSGRFGRSAGAYVDNVLVSMSGACVAPGAVTVTSVTATEAKITVDGEATEYALMAGAQGFTPDAAKAVKIGKEHTLALTGVTDIYVAGYCAGKAGELMFGPLTVRPIKTPAEVTSGLVDYFETSGEAWTFVADGQNNDWAIGIPEGDSYNRLFVSTDATAAEYNAAIGSHSWAYRSLDLKPGMYTISLDTKVEAMGDDAFMRFGLLPATSAFAAGSAVVTDATGSFVEMTTDATPAGWIALDEGIKVSDAFETHTYEFVVTNDMAGVYNLTAYWYNDNMSTGMKPSAAIDSIQLAYQACVAPYDLAIGKFTNSEAALSWKEVAVEGIPTLGFEVFVTADVETATPDAADDNLFNKTYKDIKVLTHTLDGLQGGTPMIAFVRSQCTADGYSPWSESVAFETLCDAVDTTGLVYNFDDESTLIAIDNNIFRPECFIQGHMNGESVEDYAPIVKPGGGYGMSRSGGNAISLNGTNGISANHAGGYIAMPKFNADYTDMQLVFWMRAVFTAGGEFYYPWENLDPEENDATITVGAMSDPNDISTFKKIRECKYPFTNVDITSSTKLNDDPNGNEYWVKFIIPLGDYKDQHIVFLNEGYGANGNFVYIDDITLEPYTGCMQPQDVRAIKVTSDSVLLTFNHETGDEWFVTLSDAKNMSDTIASKLTDNDTVSIAGLEENKTYYVGVTQVCGEELYSERSQIVKFTTNYGLRYEETFAKDERTPENWLRTNGFVRIDELLDGSKDLVQNINMNHQNGWQHIEVSEQASAHQKFSVTGYDITPVGGFWMISPVIYVREGENANLTFDLAVTLPESYEALLEGDIKANNTFVVAISDDEGRTYKRENAYIWNNDTERPGQFKFSELKNTFTRFTVDLSKYMDKNIRIAFSAQSLKDAVDFDVHVDNIIVNTMEVKEIEENLCGRMDYVGYGFDIPYEDLKVGEVYETERYELSTSDEPDKLFRLKLTIDSPIEKVDNVQVCESALPYTDANGFYATESGLYSKRFVREGMCDSTYSINLTVVPPVRGEILDVSICNGGKYVFNGRELKEKGTYFDTIPSVATGCDSVAIVRLSVLPAREHFDTVIICFNESYTLGEQVLTATGDYTETFYEGECDSVVHLRLIVRPEYIDIKNVAICEGDVYNDDIFKGLKQNFADTLTRKSVDQCDSIVGLELVVIPADGVVEIEKNITRDILPYTYFGHTFDTDTKDGTTVTDIPVKSQDAKCEGTIRLTLNVGEPTKPEDAVDNLRLNTLTFAPNPVASGSTVTISLDLSTDRRHGAILEVFNSVGALVETLIPPAIEPITLDCHYTSGIYIVRLTTTDGRVYQGKIIVK